MIYWLQQAHSLLRDDSILSWIAIAVFSVLVTSLIKAILKIVSHYLRALAQKTASIWDDVAVDLLDGFKSWVLIVWVFYISTKSFRPVNFERRALLFSVILVSTIQVAIWGLYLLKNWRKVYIDRRIQQDPSSSAALGLMYTISQVAFLSVVVLIGLSNAGVDISALIAGMGVGGIAIALAAQNVLGDLLASLSIVLDKPFVVGDTITSGAQTGTVEHIGIKTTRLKSISGEQLVISNKDLLESRIQNFKRMEERRVVLKFGVTYGTSLETLQKIPDWIKPLVEMREKLRFDRCHFAGFGDSSLDFELVFFILHPDYLPFMDLKQEILLEIYKKFAEEKVDFAFPSQSVYIEKIPPSWRSHETDGLSIKNIKL